MKTKTANNQKPIKLPLNKPYGIVPAGCDPSVRTQSFLLSFPVGPCKSITLGATGFDHDYDNAEDASITGPHLIWMAKNCTAPFLVELNMGTLVLAKGGRSAQQRKRMVRVAFSSSADEAAYKLAFATVQP